MLLIGCAGLALIFLIIGGVFAVNLFAINNLGGSSTGGQVTASTTCGLRKESLVEGFKMLPGPGKLGHEQHLVASSVNPSHYCGDDSNCSSVGFTAGGGAFSPHTTEQERWYFNTQWGGFNWEPTKYKKAPTLDNSKGAAEARKAIAHSKLIITSNETGKSVVVSAEESGPALWVTSNHGINSGAPPEVYKYLGTSNPYTNKPNDGKGEITVGFAEDQSIKLGPCS